MEYSASPTLLAMIRSSSLSWHLHKALQNINLAKNQHSKPNPSTLSDIGHLRLGHREAQSRIFP
jgi:hypothetical protein